MPFPQTDQKPREPQEKQKKSGLLSGIFAALVAVLVKGKALVFIVLAKFKFLLIGLKALQLSKFLLTFSTMGASVVAYSFIYGWKFAAGMVLLIFLHELGHGFAAKKLGLNVGAPIFIPFFGAVIALKEQPRSRFMNCVIGFGGPFAGMLSAIVVLACAEYNFFPDYQHLLYGLAYFAFVINLFNLLPVFGLDGDRISDPIGSLLLLLTAVIVAAEIVALDVYLHWSDPMLVIIGVLLVIRSFTRRNRSKGDGTILSQALRAAAGPAPREASVQEERLAFYAYTGLVVGLGALAGYSAQFVHRLR